MHRWDGKREGVAALIVAALVYAALSGTTGAHDLGPSLAAAVAFLAIGGIAAELWRQTTPRSVAVPGALSITMRDFAVAAALASQAFGPAAAASPASTASSCCWRGLPRPVCWPARRAV